MHKLTLPHENLKLKNEYLVKCTITLPFDILCLRVIDTLPSDLVTCNKSPEELGYTNSTSDESDLDSLDDLSQEESLTYVNHQPDKLIPLPCKNFKDEKEQMSTENTSIIHSTNRGVESLGNALDKNARSQTSNAPRFSVRKTVADKGCQVKPSNFAGILGMDTLDFKIPSLSTHTKQRPAGKYWTYEKAKRDLEIYLDPSKALAKDGSTDKVEIVGLSDDKDEKQGSVKSPVESHESDQGEDNLHDVVSVDSQVTAQAEQTVQEEIVSKAKSSSLPLTLENHEHSDKGIPKSSSYNSNLEEPSKGHVHVHVTSQTQSTVITKLTSSAPVTPVLRHHHTAGPYADLSNGMTSENDACKESKDNNERREQIHRKQKPTKPAAQTDSQYQRYVDTSSESDKKGGHIHQRPCAAKGHTRSRPLSVASMLHQIQSKATGVQDDRFQSANNCSDPVWESYRKYLPESTKQSHSASHGSLQMGSSSSNSDGSSTDSSDQTSSSSSTTDSDNNSQDQSESSESESESDGECEEEEQYSSTDEDYEDQLKQGMESLTFSQYDTTASPSYWDARYTWQGSGDAQYPYWYQVDYSPYAFSSYQQWPYQLGYQEYNMDDHVESSPYAFSSYQQWPYQQGYQEYNMGDYSSWYNTC